MEYQKIVNFLSDNTSKQPTNQPNLEQKIGLK